jgi:hypothetical protein
MQAIRDAPAMNYADLALKLRMAAENGEFTHQFLYQDADAEGDEQCAIVGAVIRDAERLAAE